MQLDERRLNISAEYLDADEPVRKERLKKAGMRLAQLLDTGFPNYPAN